jgi:monothiol glutaredoxin
MSGSSSDDVLNRAIEMLSGGDSGPSEAPETTQARIQALVEENPILLFMKGSKNFPQCGFSDTATKILETYNVEYHAVDVLSDPAIREQVKLYSQWPTIPQLYINGEFIGGSDIMIEMYQSGELKKLIDETLEKQTQ